MLTPHPGKLERLLGTVLPDLGWPRHTADEAETRALGAELARHLARDGVLLLSGDLGSGKTVLAQGVARGLGIDPAEIQSPTYTLIRDHKGPGAGWSISTSTGSTPTRCSTRGSRRRWRRRG